MLHWLFRRRSRKRTAQNLYGSIVALARQPELYERFELPDTVAGRFEVLTAHVFLYLERLRREGQAGAGIAQDLVDAFFADMDATNRELGVGDMAVAKKMRGLAAVFEERMKAYGTAIGAVEPEPLIAMIGDRIDTPDKRRLAGFASYLRELHEALNEQPLDSILTASGVSVAVPQVSEETPRR